MLSIIIPVYCVEDTLSRCMESIVSQSHANMEIILVDDGSPDRCPQICDDWAQRDTRIRVIHKENGGLSDARNAGIDAATGEWLTFVDSDDYLEDGTLEQVMAVVKKEEGNGVDIVEYPVECFCGSPKQALLSFTPRIYDDIAEYWLKEKAYEHSYAWNKIYRKNLFDAVRFPKGVLFEDIHTLPLLLQQARRIAITDQGLYHYCWNEKGITVTANGQAWKSLLEGNLKVTWVDDLYYMRMLNIQINVYKRAEKEILLPYRPVSITTKGLRVAERFKVVLLRMFGVKGVCRVFYTLHKVIRV